MTIIDNQFKLISFKYSLKLGGRHVKQVIIIDTLPSYVNKQGEKIHEIFILEADLRWTYNEKD